MKLTKSSLKEMIREVIKEEKQLNEDFGTPIDPDVVKNADDYISDKRKPGGGVKMFYNSYSSSEFSCGCVFCFRISCRSIFKCRFCINCINNFCLCRFFRHQK